MVTNDGRVAHNAAVGETAPNGADGGKGRGAHRRARTVQSVDRALRLLEAIGNAPRALTAAELARECRLDRSTAWRLLGTLERRGLVELDEAQRYSVGYGVVALALHADQLLLARRLRPVLEQLAEQTGATVNVGVPARAGFVSLDQIDDSSVLSTNWVGRTVPLHCSGTGKIFLAWLDAEARDALIPDELEAFTPFTITNADALRSELVRVRERGYATSIDEYEVALVVLSAPAFDAAGRIVACLSISGPSSRLAPKRIPELADQLLAAAGEATALLAP
jgi:DNA-binding IclR family transcriptional regulator